jgi:hypothetical protein
MTRLLRASPSEKPHVALTASANPTNIGPCLCLSRLVIYVGTRTALGYSWLPPRPSTWLPGAWLETDTGASNSNLMVAKRHRSGPEPASVAYVSHVLDLAGLSPRMLRNAGRRRSWRTRYDAYASGRGRSHSGMIASPGLGAVGG